MDVVIVYKADGTVQCCGNDPIPIEHHAAELRKLGVTQVFGQGNVPGPFLVLTLCGSPTGQVNAFAIPKEDWEMISAGIVGTLGFRPWAGAPYPNLGLCEDYIVKGVGGAGISAPTVGTTPILIRELLGRLGRCYRQGDSLTKDFVLERVNIEHDHSGRISDIWYG